MSGDPYFPHYFAQTNAKLNGPEIRQLHHDLTRSQLAMTPPPPVLREELISFARGALRADVKIPPARANTPKMARLMSIGRLQPVQHRQPIPTSQKSPILHCDPRFVLRAPHCMPHPLIQATPLNVFGSTMTGSGYTYHASNFANGSGYVPVVQQQSVSDSLVRLPSSNNQPPPPLARPHESPPPSRPLVTIDESVEQVQARKQLSPPVPRSPPRQPLVKIDGSLVRVKMRLPSVSPPRRPSVTIDGSVVQVRLEKPLLSSVPRSPPRPTAETIVSKQETPREPKGEVATNAATTARKSPEPAPKPAAKPAAKPAPKPAAVPAATPVPETTQNLDVRRCPICNSTTTSPGAMTDHINSHLKEGSYTCKFQSHTTCVNFRVPGASSIPARDHMLRRHFTTDSRQIFVPIQFILKSMGKCACGWRGTGYQWLYGHVYTAINPCRLVKQSVPVTQYGRWNT